MAKKNSLLLAVLEDKLKYGLRWGGFVIFVVGLTCMPWPLTSPKATTSLFASFAAAGLLVRYGMVLVGIGAVMFASSFFVPDDLD